MGDVFQHMFCMYGSAEVRLRFYRGRKGLWKHRGRNEVREQVDLEGQ